MAAEASESVQELVAEYCQRTAADADDLIGMIASGIAEISRRPRGGITVLIDRRQAR